MALYISYNAIDTHSKSYSYVLNNLYKAAQLAQKSVARCRMLSSKSASSYCCRAVFC